MAYEIRRVAVLGANGTMGALSGGLFAQQGVHVCFVSRSRDKSVLGIEKAVAQARSEQLARYMTAESYDNLPAVVADCDWIFEALGEDADLKRTYYEIVDRHRRSDAIVSTVSSGLSIAGLAAGRSESFRQHFLGTHFYNPPAKLPAAERIAHPETLPEVVRFVDAFMAERLRRVVIPTRDVPAFAGNRVGFQFLNQAAKLAEQHGVLTIDTLLGSYTGRALPPLKTIDLVGLDVHRAIVDNVFHNAAHDCRECFKMPDIHARHDRARPAGLEGPRAGRLLRPAPERLAAGVESAPRPARNTRSPAARVRGSGAQGCCATVCTPKP
jgi:3-hydroxyacyl-CoA dehydrogenase